MDDQLSDYEIRMALALLGGEFTPTEHPMLLDHYLEKRAIEAAKVVVRRYRGEPAFRAMIDRYLEGQLEKQAGGKEIALGAITLLSAGVEPIRNDGRATPASIIETLGGMDPDPIGGTAATPRLRRQADLPRLQTHLTGRRRSQQRNR